MRHSRGRSGLPVGLEPGLVSAVNFHDDFGRPISNAIGWRTHTPVPPGIGRRQMRGWAGGDDGRWIAQVAVLRERETCVDAFGVHRGTAQPNKRESQGECQNEYMPRADARQNLRHAKP